MKHLKLLNGFEQMISSTYNYLCLKLKYNESFIKSAMYNRNDNEIDKFIVERYKLINRKLLYIEKMLFYSKFKTDFNIYDFYVKEYNDSEKELKDLSKNIIEINDLKIINKNLDLYEYKIGPINIKLCNICDSRKVIEKIENTYYYCKKCFPYSN